MHRRVTWEVAQRTAAARHECHQFRHTTGLVAAMRVHVCEIKLAPRSVPLMCIKHVNKVGRLFGFARNPLVANIMTLGRNLYVYLHENLNPNSMPLTFLISPYVGGGAAAGCAGCSATTGVIAAAIAEAATFPPPMAPPPPTDPCWEGGLGTGVAAAQRCHCLQGEAEAEGVAGQGGAEWQAVLVRGVAHRGMAPERSHPPPSQPRLLGDVSHLCTEEGEKTISRCQVVLPHMPPKVPFAAILLNYSCPRLKTQKYQHTDRDHGTCQKGYSFNMCEHV